MSSGKELVSVIIPAYKMGQFIGEALESVGAQTYPHWEVIVVDDAGPEDGTRAAVEAFAAKHPDHRVEHILHKTNQGVSVARRTAFETSHGEYIAFLDADDAFLPEKLARHVAILDREQECVLVHGPIESEGLLRFLGEGGLGWFRLAEESFCYNATRRPEYLREDHVCNSSIVVRRRAMHKADFPSRMTFQHEDWLLVLLVAMRGRFYYDSKTLTKYRYHEGGFMWRMSNWPGAEQWARIELLLAFLQRASGCKLPLRAAGELLRCINQVAGASAQGNPALYRLGILRMGAATFVTLLWALLWAPVVVVRKAVRKIVG